MPDGEVRAARGGEPAGARTPRGAGCRPARARVRDFCHAWQGHCALWYAYGYQGRERRIGTAGALSTRPVSM